MSETNGAAPGRVNHEFVRLLETALADAKAGRIVAGGVAICMGNGGFAAFTATSVHYAECIAAAAVMQDDVILKMRAPRQPAIVRAPAAAGMRQ